MYFRSIITKSRSVGTLALVCVLASATPILPTLSASAQTESAEIVSEVAERLFFKNALNGVTTFSEQFDVESEISALILNSADLYQSDDMNDAIQPLIDEIDVRLFRLLDQRAEILQHRMTLMQG